MRILITGGAGYIGTKLTSLLIKNNYDVTIFDNLIFGGDFLLQFVSKKNFHFIKGDIRKIEDIKNANISEFDVIIHLASIVGYPACRANPVLAKETNINGTKNILKLKNKKQLLIFASTGSNYGKKKEIVNENSKLDPLSLYAESKVINENMIKKKENFIIYRFATAFGSSPRMRLDLLVNDFLFKALTEGYLVVYEKKHQRSFIHVDDIARSILFAIKNSKKMKNEIFNVGDESMNFSKEEICEKIKNKIKKLYIHYAEVDKDVDQRNYIVSYEKIKKIGFKTKVSIDEGLNELLKSIPLLKKNKNYTNI
jgi:nucleoside-diphosphate-sugar epimerase